ncbi:MAG: metallophosphoesterase [Pseudomonadota bacterium]
MRLTRRQIIQLGFLGCLGLVGGLGFWGSRSLRLVRTSIWLDRLPEAFDGLKIGLITDIHSGSLVPQSLIRGGVDLIKAQQPDLIFLTGDFITGASLFAWGRMGEFKPKYLETCLEELSRLSAPLGQFAVLGNHDFWSGPEAVRAVHAGLTGLGVQVLRNEALRLTRKGQGLTLAGVDDYWNNTCDIDRCLKDQPQDVCTILLSHNPDINRDVSSVDQRVDLIVSGHTHGGQVVLPFIGSPFMPSYFGQKYRVGLVQDPGRQTFVSRGLGVFMVPLRLNCPPEVNLITLKKKA